MSDQTALALDAPRKSAASLRFAPCAGRTSAVGLRAEAPIKVLQPRHAGPAAWACLSSLGGGLVDGDALALSVEAEPDAQAALTTQASTKVYPGSSSLRLDAAIDERALLVVAPDPLVCYAGARYHQSQIFDLAPHSSLAVIDWLTSGRAARGERWNFSSYEARLLVRRAGRELLVDALRLDPEAGPLPARLGRWNLLGLAFICGPKLAAGTRALLSQAARWELRRRSGLIVSAAPIGPDGLLLRIAAESVEEAVSELRARLSFVWNVLGDDPWSARY